MSETRSLSRRVFRSPPPGIRRRLSSAQRHTESPRPASEEVSAAHLPEHSPGYLDMWDDEEEHELENESAEDELHNSESDEEQDQSEDQDEEEEESEDTDSEDVLAMSPDFDSSSSTSSTPSEIFATPHMSAGGELHTPQRSAVLGLAWGSQELDADNFPLDNVLRSCEEHLGIPNFSAMEVMHSNRPRRWPTEEEYAESMRETMKAIVTGEGRVGRVGGKRDVIVDQDMADEFQEHVEEDGRYGAVGAYCTSTFMDRLGEETERVWFGLFWDGSSESGGDEEEDGITDHGKAESTEGKHEEGEEVTTPTVPSIQKDSPSRKRRASTTEESDRDVTPGRTKRTRATGRVHNAMT